MCLTSANAGEAAKVAEAVDTSATAMRSAEAVTADLRATVHNMC